MPLERVSKPFKDISSSFKVSPLNSDLISIRNETAISRSIRNLILTSRGERFFNENLGTTVSDSLFENINSVDSSLIETQIRDTINSYEPRVTLVDVTVVPNYDEGSYEIVITYNIIGIDALAQQLTFALEQTR